ncbi:hypothetical protein [Paenibacillus sp. Leaf72]|uniref:hypothetical protein n=1 Tax=Paenibacillus sp. Leaf72 TaxID=1736234 RepID=UPI000700E716|nr:hypothetical protein [Paenibacillus sp. Leaf72]KQN96822.1 hypothetical protein ASF12_22380 [Paenibacillus sp. Leaf72]
MKFLDMFIFSIYSNDNDQMRKIVRFFEGTGGEERLKYEIGFITDKGRWFSSGATLGCSKKTFARWARSKVRAGYMCRHGEDSSICKDCEAANNR